MFKNNLNRSVGGNILLLIVLVLVACFMLLPIAYAITTAFKPIDEIYLFPPPLLAKKPTFSNFTTLVDLLSDSWVPVSRYVFNSLFVAAIGIIGHIFIASMAAYPMSKLEFVGKKLYSSVITLALLFSFTVIYIARYVVFAKIHLMNTYWALILPAWASALGLYLMMNFMMQIPNSLLESARIDGANEMTVWWKIVMPNVKPAWMTMAIFSFVDLWATGGQFIYSENLKQMQNVFSTAAVAGSGVSRAGAGAAGAVILMIPPVLLFLFCQNNVLETMTTSGMKD